MKKILACIVLSSMCISVFAGNLKGKCQSLPSEKNKLIFDLHQTDSKNGTYQFVGTRSSFLRPKDFTINSEFKGIYKNQFYAFTFNAPFINEAELLLIRREEYRKEEKIDDGFIIDSSGNILNSLMCEDLNR